MKKFLLYLLKILVLTLLMAVVLDVIYTAVFLQSGNRNKIDKVFNSKNENYDVVILGSSRANNHFVSQMFEDRGLKTFNYGMSGGHLYEASLLLKLMVERRYKIKNVLLEADLNLSNDHHSEGISAKFLPYLHSSDIIRKHFEKDPIFWELYYIPFYRYIKFENIIGSRETFFNIIHRQTAATQNKGYYALITRKGNMKNNIVSLNPLVKNKYYEEIKQLCKEQQINFIAVMTPMCENTKGMDYFDKVKKHYPEIHNYENAVIEDKYFSSCGHMNDSGAKRFTAIILKDFFNKK